MSLTENFKLRCPINECRTITMPVGTAMGGAITAGAVKAFNGLLAIAVDDVSVDASNNSDIASVWVTFAPKVQVAKAADTGLTWGVGQKLYYDAALGFTGLGTRLACCGYALEAKLATDTSGLMCFIGDNPAIVADVTEEGVG